MVLWLIGRAPKNKNLWKESCMGKNALPRFYSTTQFDFVTDLIQCHFHQELVSKGYNAVVENVIVVEKLRFTLNREFLEPSPCAISGKIQKNPNSLWRHSWNWENKIILIVWIRVKKKKCWDLIFQTGYGTKILKSWISIWTWLILTFLISPSKETFFVKMHSLSTLQFLPGKWVLSGNFRYLKT